MRTTTEHTSSSIVYGVVVFVVFLYISWIGAWVLERTLERSV